MEHINDNIGNLLSLWTTVGKPFNGYASDGTISYCQIQDSEWPNKIWLNQKLTTEIADNIKLLIEKSKFNMWFIDFESKERTNNRFIEKSGLVLTSSLPGMHLKLTKSFETNTRLNFKMVTKTSEAEVWIDIFKQSFGYVISKDLVIKNMNKIHFYIAFENNKPVGVVKLHLTKNVAGIYSLGVPEVHRGKGYAKQMMHFALNKAMQKGATLATLQASKLAQGMYERMGFKKDFTMNSYKLKTE